MTATEKIVKMIHPFTTSPKFKLYHLYLGLFDFWLLFNPCSLRLVYVFKVLLFSGFVSGFFLPF